MILAFVLSTILDVHSTCLSLHVGNKEAFLPFKTCTSIVVSQGLGTAGVISLDKFILNKHKKLERVIFISAIIVRSTAAVHNYRLYAKTF